MCFAVDTEQSPDRRGSVPNGQDPFHDVATFDESDARQGDSELCLTAVDSLGALEGSPESLTAAAAPRMDPARCLLRCLTDGAGRRSSGQKYMGIEPWMLPLEAVDWRVGHSVTAPSGEVRLFDLVLPYCSERLPAADEQDSV